MQKFFTLILLILYSLTDVAQTLSSDPEGSLANGKFLLNKKEINKDWKLLTLDTALGSASRFTEGATNKVHMYDKNGIVIYESKKSGKPTGVINEFSIYFSIKQSNQLIPYNLYPGSFEIESIKITKNSKWEDIKKTLEDKGYKSNGEYSYVKGGIYIIFRFSDNGLLENISIGKA
jgi:cell division protein FtsL